MSSKQVTIKTISGSIISKDGSQKISIMSDRTFKNTSKEDNSYSDDPTHVIVDNVSGTKLGRVVFD